MKNLDSPDSIHAPISQNLLLKMEPQRNKILGDIATLLERGDIEDKIDRELVVKAVAFIENPTEDLSDITSHTTIIGQALTTMQEAPSEIVAMYSYFFALQCINRINFVEEKLSQETPADSPEIRKAMSRGLDWATTLSIGHNDHISLITAFHELQARLNSLQNPQLLHTTQF
ncbi:MAG: hypothetical protein GWP15_02930 [Nitrospirae bacterium]|nr:hypothetical protein [Nitrospirota bacterium]